MSDNPRITHPLQRLWLTEAIRLREEHAGLLDDSEVNRRAQAQGGDISALIETRALLLAKRDGQAAALVHALQGARLAGWLIFLGAIICGSSLAVAALGNGQQAVNVFWALGSLLGVNWLLLLGWLLTLVVARDSGGALGRIWLWLSSKLARDAQAAQLAPALLLLLSRQRLTRWGLGAIVHSFWLVSLLCALATLLIMLSTRRYGFVWESTLWSSDSFVTLTQWLGHVPAMLGFSLPDAELIRQSGSSALADESARQQWASWLVGVLLFYGLAPRLLLALYCTWRWRSAVKRLQLDLSLPDYQLLRERLQPSAQRIGVVDADPGEFALAASAPTITHQQGALLVAIELDPKRNWPPSLPQGVSDAGVIDSREQRRQLLAQLSRYPAERLLIACDPRRSADRGTLALIAELSRSANSTRVWLLPAPEGESLNAERLHDWQLALEKLQLIHSSSAAFGWLENGHD